MPWKVTAAEACPTAKSTADPAMERARCSSTASGQAEAKFQAASAKRPMAGSQPPSITNMASTAATTNTHPEMRRRIGEGNR